VTETWSPPVGNYSPGPNEEVRDGKIFWGYSISGSDERGAHILPTLGAIHNFPDQIHANAAFIVQAVNSHYGLIEALEKARDTFRHYGDLHAAKPDEVKAKRNYDLADEMDAALKAARGEKS